MEFNFLLNCLEGVIPFIPTPFIADGPCFTKIAEEGFRKNLGFLSKFPFSCVCPAAGTGDIMTLTDEEYKTVLRITMEELKERFLILPGLPQETERAIRLAGYAKSIGYECLLSFPGPFLNLSETGLIAHWRAIAKKINIPIVIFRPPWLQYSMNVLESLSDCENIIAVKEETGDLMWFKNATIQYGHRYVFIGGGEFQFVNYLLAGARAITTGIPNFLPKPFFAIFEYAKANNYKEAERIHETLLPLITLRQKQGNAIPLLKYAMNETGLLGGINRLPQIEASDDDKTRLKLLLEEFKTINYL